AIAVAHPHAEVTGVDPSPKMIERAKEKVGERATFALGDATQLDFADRSFDRLSIAFGMRNIPDRPRALKEIARVLSPGGRAAILELATPDQGWLAPLARFHVAQIVPRIGALLSGAREYRHLERSIAAFPRAEEFARMIKENGLSMQRIERL